MRGSSFDISDDRRRFTTIVKGTNNDSGSVFISALDMPVRARHLRFNTNDKFPDDAFTWARNQVKFTDIWVGNLAATHKRELAARSGF